MTERFKPKAMRLRGEARRAAIIDAASRVFFEKGYEAATLSDILAQAGGSKTLFYEQFGDKERLLEEVIQRKSMEILQPLDDAAALGAEPATILRNLGRSFMKILTSVECVSLARMVMSEGGRIPSVARIFFERGPDIAQERLRDFFEQLKESGQMTIDEPRLAAKAFYAMIHTDTVLRLISGHPTKASSASIAKQIDFAVTTFVRAYGCSSP